MDRTWLKRIPFSTKIYEKTISLLWARSNAKLLKQLDISGCPKASEISTALKALRRWLPRPDQGYIHLIEKERQRLLRLDEKLNDGTLGESGLYDGDLTIREACLASKPPRPALLLFLLTRCIRPLNVIELGTNVGISSAYIALALKANGQNGRLITLDASPYRQRVAQEVHRHLGIGNVKYMEGLFSDTLRPTLESLATVDLAFIDGHHQFQPTLDYFETIFQFSTEDTIFVFDDIRWSAGMKKAWSKIQSDSRLGHVVDLSSVGICTRSQGNSRVSAYDSTRFF